jgi:DNA modification methylase
MQIKEIEVTKLIPYANNSRTHDDAQVAQLAASIKEFGFRNPILVDGVGIIAGHGRLLAARKLGLEKVPTIDCSDMTETQKKAYIIADNKLALNSGWDTNLLSLELEALDADGFNLELLGFDSKELDELLAPEVVEGLTDEDAVPDVPDEPKTKLGDIYILGNHRLMCGDSTSITDVEKLMDGKKADMVFTSPPYNANTMAGDGGVFDSKPVKLYKEGYSDNLSSADYIDFIKSVLNICFTATDGFIFWNVNYNAKSKFEYIKQIEDRIDYLVEQICWKKSSTIPFKGMLKRAWEPIYVFSTNKQNLNVKEITENFWEVSNVNSQHKEHKACFPVALPEKGIHLVNANTGIIFEPFCGSGTTVIAAEKNNRKCYGMELDPKYCDVIVKRWEDFTGKQAILSEL